MTIIEVPFYYKSKKLKAVVTYEPAEQTPGAPGDYLYIQGISNITELSKELHIIEECEEVILKDAQNIINNYVL